MSQSSFLPHEASSASKGKNKNFLMYIFSLGLNTPYNKIWMRKFEWYRRKLCLYFSGKLAFRISNAGHNLFRRLEPLFPFPEYKPKLGLYILPATWILYLHFLEDPVTCVRGHHF